MTIPITLFDVMIDAIQANSLALMKCCTIENTTYFEVARFRTIPDIQKAAKPNNAIIANGKFYFYILVPDTKQNN